MDSSNPENDQPTIKIGGGGQSSPSQPRRGSEGGDPNQGTAGDYSYEAPPMDWEDPPARGGMPNVGGEAPPTIVGMNRPVSGLGSANPPAQETVLIRPNKKPALAWLVVAEGPYAGHLYSLSGDKTIIGRESAHIVLGDPSVSGQHAAVWAEQSGEGENVFHIQDLASSNGTFVNGDEQIKVHLADGDRLKLGDTVLVFKQV